MVHAANKEKYLAINRIIIAERASLEEVDWPSPYSAIFILSREHDHDARNIGKHDFRLVLLHPMLSNANGHVLGNTGFKIWHPNLPPEDENVCGANAICAKCWRNAREFSGAYAVPNANSFHFLPNLPSITVCVDIPHCFLSFFFSLAEASLCLCSHNRRGHCYPPMSLSVTSQYLR